MVQYDILIYSKGRPSMLLNIALALMISKALGRRPRIHWPRAQRAQYKALLPHL